MFMIKHVKILGMVAVIFMGSGALEAQEAPPSLVTIKSAKCTFTALATGAWEDGKVAAVVKPEMLTMEFDSIDVDGGVADLPSNEGGAAGRSDLLVKLSKGTVHFVQIFTDGPLYITTLFPEWTRPGRVQAVHTRHEFTPGIRLAGFTWQPEQYYGECELKF
jgi:hypothetical protein